MLTHYYEHTFDCPILYYNKKTDEIKYVVSKENNEINWKNFIINYSHIKKEKDWNESTTLYVNNRSVGEFQIHKKRDGIKFRWCFETILDLFEDHFIITTV